MLKSITVDGNVIDVKEISEEELKEFLNSLASKQVEELFSVVLKTPSLEYEVKQKCNKCGKDLTYTFRGLYDFFI